MSFVLSFLLPERLHFCCIYFHCSLLYNYYSYLEPCALNPEYQHFILRFIQIFSLWGDHWKGGLEGERRPKDRVILWITLLYFTLSLLSPHMLRVKHSPNAGTHRFYVSQEVDTSTTRAQLVKRWNSSVLGCNSVLPSKAFFGGTGPRGLSPSYMDGNKHVSIYLDKETHEKLYWECTIMGM